MVDADTAKHRGKHTSMWAQLYQCFGVGDKQLQDKDQLCEVGITDGDTGKELRGGRCATNPFIAEQSDARPI
jgi:hypothetical protein